MYDADACYTEFEGATLADILNASLEAQPERSVVASAHIPKHICPECGCKLARVEGCFLCHGCGWAVCG